MTLPKNIYQFGLLLGLVILCTTSLRGQSNLSIPVSLIADGLSIEDCLLELEGQTEFQFSYSRDFIPEEKEITGNYRKRPLKEVLESILKGTDIHFKIIGNQILLIPQSPNAHRKTILNGFVRDKTSGEALIGAVVYDKHSGIGTYTNNYGFYSLDLPPDSLQVVASYMGYDKTITEIRGGGSQRITWELEPSKLELGTIEIIEDEQDTPELETQMSQFKISLIDLKKIPLLAGEVDALKAFQLLPGVASGFEGSSGLYVRGGGPDQNLILLDDVPVYNSAHLFGFFSVFNPDAIHSIELTKGGFPARYGGRLSSTLDVRLKEGNMKEFGMDAAIGLISSKVTVEGPLKKDKTSYMLSGRRTYLDALSTPFLHIVNKKNTANGDGAYFIGYRFWDLNAKINHKFSKKDRLFFSIYSGKDTERHRIRFTNRDNPLNDYAEQRGGFSWKNLISSMRWNHLFSDRLFVNTTLIYSDYQFTLDDEVDEIHPDPTNSSFYSTTYLSRIRDLGIKTDFFFRPGRKHNIRWGGAVTQHKFRPGANRTVRIGGSIDDTETSFGAPTIPALEGYVYAEDEIRFHPRISANLGLHASIFNVRGRSYKSIQPRLATRFQINKKTAFKISYVTMAQNLHLLTNSGVGLPTDLWVPPTEKVLPQNSSQVAAGIAGSLGKKYEWSFEGYYKKMENVITYKEGSLFISTPENWEENVIAGNRKARGLEFFLHKKKGRLTGWIGYTLSKTENQFAELNDGNHFPYKYDRRHDASITANYHVSEKVELSANWVYGTGQAATIPIARAATSINYSGTPNDEQFVYGDRNNFRMPSSHRLDLGISLYKKKRWGERWWNFSIYNAYNRFNPFFVDVRPHGSFAEGKTLFLVTLFPIMPSFSYRIKI